MGKDGIIGKANDLFNGYIDDLYITKGIARYEANFMPLIRPLPNR